jgi:hypothetical protein
MDSIRWQRQDPSFATMRSSVRSRLAPPNPAFGTSGSDRNCSSTHQQVSTHFYSMSFRIANSLFSSRPQSLSGGSGLPFCAAPRKKLAGSTAGTNV